VNVAERNEVKKIKINYPMSSVAGTVKQMKNEWESRSSQFPFFTIGKNSYQDSIEDYFNGLDHPNKRLLEEFEGFYSVLIQALSESEGEPVYLDHSLSIPGFHIFPSDPILKKVKGPWHVDIPHEKLGLSSDHARGYTLAIELPTGGGGMEFYQEDGDHDYIRYKAGRLYIHDGQSPHRIASLKEYRAGDFRITLQGHIIRRKGKLVTFW